MGRRELAGGRLGLSIAGSGLEGPLLAVSSEMWKVFSLQLTESSSVFTASAPGWGGGWAAGGQSEHGVATVRLAACFCASPGAWGWSGCACSYG